MPQNAYMAVDNPQGLVEQGNLPIWNRPVVQNADGSHSSEYSTSFSDDKGREVLVPTVVGGRFLTADGKKPQEGSAAEKAMFGAAWDHYTKTGEHLGKFANSDAADAYSIKLHERPQHMPQEPLIVDPSKLSPVASGGPLVVDPAALQPMTSDAPRDSFMDKVGHAAEDVIYPSVGAAAGLALGGVGGAETGPGAAVTALTGAGLGAGIGTELKRGVRAARGRSDLNPSGWGHVAETGTDMLSGPVQEFKAGMKLAGPAIMADINKVSPRVARMINDHIGLKANDLAKWKRTLPNAPLDIGETVYKEAGFNPNLGKQKGLIDAAIDKGVDSQEKLVDTATKTRIPDPAFPSRIPAAPKADILHTLLDKQQELQHEILLQHGADTTKLGAVVANQEKYATVYGRKMNPQQVLDMRREIRPTDWDMNTQNIGQRYRQLVYHDLNNKIEQMLPPDAQEAFRTTNKTIHDLIIASDAAGEKLHNGNLKYDNPIKSAAKVFSPSKWPGMVPNAHANAAQNAVAPTAVRAGKALSKGMKFAATRAGLGGAVVDGMQGDDDGSQ